jgi:hypothetical protein
MTRTLLPAPVCPSCHDRGWNAVQGFQGEGDDAELIYTRTPCGCTESRAQFLEEDQLAQIHT